MAFQHHLECVLLHPVTLRQCDTLCGGKPLRQMVVDSAVQFIELLVAYRSLYSYGCGAEILREFNGPTHTLDVDSLLVALSASPAGKLDYQRKTNDVYLQLAVYAEQCLVTLQIALVGVVVLPRIQFSFGCLTKGELVRQ